MGLGDAVNSLIKNRKEYDREIAQVDFFSGALPKSVVIFGYITLALLLILLLDACLTYRKYLVFQEKVKKMSKKEIKKSGYRADEKFDFKMMLLYRTFIRNSKMKYD